MSGAEFVDERGNLLESVFELVVKGAVGCQTDPKGAEALIGRKLFDGDTITSVVLKMDLLVRVGVGDDGGVTRLRPFPTDGHPETLVDVKVATGGAEVGLPTEAKGFNSFRD